MTAIEEFTSLYKKKGTAYAYRAALLDFLSFVYDVRRKGQRATKEEYKKYENLADRYLAEVKKKKRDSFHDLERYAVSMNGPILPKTARIRVAANKEWLAHNRIKIEPDDAKRIRNKLPKARAVTKERTITKEMLATITQYLDVRGRALVLFLASSGCRIGEALQIELRDIDLTRTPALVHVREEITKTGDERHTFVSEECKAMLVEWLRVRDKYLTRAKFKGAGLNVNHKENNPYLFGIGRTVAYTIWDNAVRKAGMLTRDERSGYNQVRIHGLRKFFRSYMGLKIPPDVAEALIGHAEGLESIYRRYTVDQLAAEYLKGMGQVTINDVDPATRERVDSLAEENEQLRRQVEEIRQKQEEVTNKLNQAREQGELQPEYQKIQPEYQALLDKFTAELYKMQIKNKI